MASKGQKFKNRGPQINDFVAIAKYSNGKTLAQVAAEMGISSAAVIKALKRRGIARRHSWHFSSPRTKSKQNAAAGTRSLENPFVVVAKYLNGKPMCQVAEELGITRNVVRAVLDRFEIPIRPISRFEVGKRPEKMQCGTCKELKPLTSFGGNARRRFGIDSQCRECRSKRMRRGHLQQRWGLTEAQFDDMVKAQDGRCAICCGRDAIKRLVVDHCHRTKKIRALLCDACNQGLGFFKDDPVRLKSAVYYLKDFGHLEDGKAVA